MRITEPALMSDSEVRASVGTLCSVVPSVAGRLKELRMALPMESQAWQMVADMELEFVAAVAEVGRLQGEMGRRGDGEMGRGRAPYRDGKSAAAGDRTLLES